MHMERRIRPRLARWLAPAILALAVAAPASAAKTQQTIAFAPLPDRTYGAVPFTVSATASSNLAVRFASRTPAICAVRATTVTVRALGTCTIRASQGGNATYAAATHVDRSFTVVKVAQTITFDSLSDRRLGTAPFGIGATASSGLPVSFVSLAAAVCTVTASTVTLVGVGTCTVRATQPGNATIAPAPDIDRSFLVASATTYQLKYGYDPVGNVRRITRIRMPGTP